MIELFKKSTEKENISFKELFTSVPTLKEPWIQLQSFLNENAIKQKNNFRKLSLINEQFDVVLKKLSQMKNSNISNIKENSIEKKELINEEFNMQRLSLKENFFKEQNHIKSELEKIEIAHQHQYKSLKSELKELAQSLENEKNTFDKKLKESRVVYLNKVNSIYKQKSNEENRITAKYHDQIQDYHQKNKQRLTQNTLKIQDEDNYLKEYLEFHEKDEVYAKQIFLKTLTNINDKTHLVSANYKKIENKLKEDFVIHNQKLIEKLDSKKEEIDNLIIDVLNNYEVEYKEIDSFLDELRKDYHKNEERLKNKYNQDITSINIDLHNKEDEINNLLSALDSDVLEDKKEISLLNSKLHSFKKDTKRKIKKAKKDYKNAYKNTTKSFLFTYESNLIKRSLKEQDKNTVISLYNHLYSLKEDLTNSLITFNKEINDIKEEIVLNYKQLEIMPLESQVELANHIYNYELKLQTLENEYVYLITSREKQLAILKSNLHKYNLNKTKNRIESNYNIELTLSNLNYYLQMEAEKNLFVYENNLTEHKINRLNALNNNEALKIDQEVELSTMLEKHKIEYFNLLLHNKIELKNINDNLINETNDYFIKKESLFKKQEKNKTENEDFLNKTKNDNAFLNEVIDFYNNLYIQLKVDEKEILDVFLENSLENTNFDDFEVLLKATKELLLLKENILKELINEFYNFLNNHLNKNVLSFFDLKLFTFENEITEYYDSQILSLTKKQTFFNERLTNHQEKINDIRTSISSSNEQVSYSAKTIEYTKKELKALEKSNLKEKNLKIINDLKDHIAINKKFKIETLKDLKETEKTLKRLLKEEIPLKKEVRQVNFKLQKINKQKDKILSALRRMVNNKANVFKNFFNKVTNLKDNFNRINNIYYQTINTSDVNHETISKTKNSLVKSLNKRHSFLDHFFSKLYICKDNCYKKLMQIHSNDRLNQVKREKKELHKLNKSHKKKVSEINVDLKNSLSNHKKELNKHAKKEKKQLFMLKKEHQSDLKEAKLHIKHTTEAIPKFKLMFKDLQNAFLLNKEELIKKEKDTIKKQRKDSFKENQKLIRETSHNIKRLNSDIAYDERRHDAQLKYLFERDKQERKRLLAIQNKNFYKHSNQIDLLFRKIPKINLEIRYFEAKTKIANHETLKKIKNSTSSLTLTQKIGLRLNVWRKSSKSYKDFKKSFNK